MAADFTICFSPKNDCRSKIISLIDNTKSTLDIAIFSLTSDEITAAIISAKERHVHIRLIMDKQQSKIRGGDYILLKNSGVNIKLDNTSGYMHNKYVISDNTYILTGSYNFTANAEKRNFENFIISNDLELVNEFNKNFTEMWELF
jgi:phosphatidylserine/phosphatidylglycerophosphate/cardiolipin synthase-like enzyme